MVIQYILDTINSLQKYLPNNCNNTKGNDGTSDLDILNDLRYKNLNCILIILTSTLSEINLKSLCIQ